MRPRTHNPLLPKPPVIRWRKGPFARKPPQSDSGPITTVAPSEHGGRSLGQASDVEDAVARIKAVPVRAYPEAGKLSFETGAFFAQSTAGWGSNLDMVPLAHGPLGCGAFTQTSRLNMPGFVQGIESYTALDIGTDFNESDFEDAGNKKLARAIDETRELFPLARGITILREDPLALFNTDIKAIVGAKTTESEQLIISVPTDAAGRATALQAAAKLQRSVRDNSYDIAIPFYRGATGLVWIIAKLLREIGLNPILEFTGSSTSDMGNIGKCKLAISFFDNLDDTDDSHRGGPRSLWQWYGMPLVPACFVTPSTTDASLRRIASHFDMTVQQRAETVIAANGQRTDAIVARLRPRLKDKLVLLLHDLPEAQYEVFHLLGMRVGTRDGWLGKRGVMRTPRLVFKFEAFESSLASYIAEAKPDLVFYVRYDETNWKKWGLPGLPFSPFFDQGRNLCWGYDGFAGFATELDRTLNAPWRKLMKPAWPEQSG